MKLITATRGDLIKVDDEDFDRLSAFNWHIRTGGGYICAYRQVKVNGVCRVLKMHREILGLIPGDPEVDHIDHDGLNNQKANLRLATRSQNIANCRKVKKRTTSKYKGVYFDRGMSLWRAKITLNKKSRHLGYFKSEIEAARVYDEAAISLFGEFACLNNA